jgi:ferritin
VLSPKIKKAFNEHDNVGAYFSYLYMAMTAWFQG